jgi:hypothetical protein
MARRPTDAYFCTLREADAASAPLSAKNTGL